MNGSFRLGKLAGIDIDINISWLIAIVLITFSLPLDGFLRSILMLRLARICCWDLLRQFFCSFLCFCMSWPIRW